MLCRSEYIHRFAQHPLRRCMVQRLPTAGHCPEGQYRFDFSSLHVAAQVRNLVLQLALLVASLGRWVLAPSAWSARRQRVPVEGEKAQRRHVVGCTPPSGLDRPWSPWLLASDPPPSGVVFRSRRQAGCAPPGGLGLSLAWVPLLSKHAPAQWAPSPLRHLGRLSFP